MPYCVQCGSGVGDGDQYCGKCGTKQASASGGADAVNQVRGFLSGVSARNAATCCYIPFVGWIAAILVLASDRFRRDDRVRFHAFQGLYLFAAWVLVDWLISPWPGRAFGFGFPLFRMVEGFLKLGILGAWIFMMIRVNHDQDYHLPILGELAERSVSEQRL